jgi:hypothetical protein
MSGKLTGCPSCAGVIADLGRVLGWSEAGTQPQLDSVWVVDFTATSAILLGSASAREALLTLVVGFEVSRARIFMTTLQASPTQARKTAGWRRD